MGSLVQTHAEQPKSELYSTYKFISLNTFSIKVAAVEILSKNILVHLNKNGILVFLMNY